MMRAKQRKPRSHEKGFNLSKSVRNKSSYPFIQLRRSLAPSRSSVGSTVSLSSSPDGGKGDVSKATETKVLQERL
jgi:hypothetical protein